MWKEGFTGRIISFEPQEEAYSLLVANASKIEGWDVAARMCVGDKDGMASLNLSVNSVSSSLLPVLESSTSVQPGSAYFAQTEVPLRRLDSWVAEELTESDGAIAVKVDVQGFEDAVLQGAEKVLDQIVALELEMSLTALYEGAPSFIELYAKVEALGFSCVGLYPGFTDRATYRMLQVDGLFAKV
ncbi:MAG: FkbM family methyltransferase [Alphaproteobacteria bacterium]|jgi:FkbM family methyltransferase|nr:FkbM family methyltransferase [Alphaproteobacteria bacterium]